MSVIMFALLGPIAVGLDAAVEMFMALAGCYFTENNIHEIQ
jgi:hypothetical protein